MSEKEIAKVHAQKPEFYKELATGLLDEAASKIVVEGLDGAEKERKSSAHLLDNWLKDKKKKEFLNKLPIPHTISTNNPDIVVLRENVSGRWKERPISTFKLLARATPEGERITARRNEIIAKGDATTPEEQAELDRLDNRETGLVKKLREAADLYHQIVAATNVKLDNGEELRATLIRVGDVPTGQIQLEAGKWEDLAKGGKAFLMTDGQVVPLSVPSFLNLNFKPQDDHANPTGYKLATWDNIRKTNRRGTNNNGPSGNDKAEAPKFKDIDRKNFGDYCNTINQWAEDQDGKYWANLTDQETLFAICDLTDTLIKIRGRIAKQADPLIEKRNAAKKAA